MANENRAQHMKVTKGPIQMHGRPMTRVKIHMTKDRDEGTSDQGWRLWLTKQKQRAK